MAKTQGSDWADDLDDVDVAILRALSDDADTTNKALAQRLGLAESTCAHRIRALRARGVIRDTRARLDGAALGLPLQAIIRVRLGNHTPEGVRAVYDALVATPRVLQVFHVAGMDDFLVHVAVQDATALRDIVLEHITVHAIVRATETQLVFELRDGAGMLA
ncbi:Lrp/AsnC family transcriptional regulator [Microbacterium hominis]|uniref:Lrp/AsnC family transcriptional regulator n=1 Tax=Microbacterium hominis TaxID=162426 RepID=A0A7D4QBH3_9MICO|nr:Lrp/AsnC family transcriptional regulator [Microbacterium hominis]QKJ18517.1 Lrp/AsnC family transcriptional regulator [Microbacterium hominis]